MLTFLQELFILGDISVKFWKDWLVYLKVLVLLVLLVRMHSATQKLATKECNYKYCSHNLVSIVILHHHRCYRNGEVRDSSNMYSTLVNIIG